MDEIAGNKHKHEQENTYTAVGAVESQTKNNTRRICTQLWMLWNLNTNKENMYTTSMESHQKYRLRSLGRKLKSAIDQDQLGYNCSACDGG